MYEVKVAKTLAEALDQLKRDPARRTGAILRSGRWRPPPGGGGCRPWQRAVRRFPFARGFRARSVRAALLAWRGTNEVHDDLRDAAEMVVQRQ